jgi:hypothetical protein
MTVLVHIGDILSRIIIVNNYYNYPACNIRLYLHYRGLYHACYTVALLHRMYTHEHVAHMTTPHAREHAREKIKKIVKDKV